MANEFQVICDRPDMTVIPTATLVELQKARFAIELIGSSIDSYGVNTSIVELVCKHFGYEHKEDNTNA